MMNREYTRLHMIIARAMGQATGHAVTEETLVFVGESGPYGEYSREQVQQAITDLVNDGFIKWNGGHFVWAR
jgi:hypothetical protein